MMNYIWAAIMLLSMVVAFFTGRVDETISAAMSASKNAIFTVLGFAGIMCMWTGIMKIAERSGLIYIISKLARPIGKILFPNIPFNSPAMNAIMLNIIANLLGLGNAATPMGIKAMQEMGKLEGSPSVATNSMCTFVTINAACFQLIPSTIISIRAAAGSGNPAIIMVPIWMSSLTALIIGIIACKIFEKVSPVSKPLYFRHGERSKLKRCT